MLWTVFDQICVESSSFHVEAWLYWTSIEVSCKPKLLAALGQTLSESLSLIRVLVTQPQFNIPSSIYNHYYMWLESLFLLSDRRKEGSVDRLSQPKGGHPDTPDHSLLVGFLEHDETYLKDKIPRKVLWTKDYKVPLLDLDLMRCSLPCRSCTDVVCCVIFIIGILGYIALGSVGEFSRTLSSSHTHTHTSADSSAEGVLLVCGWAICCVFIMLPRLVKEGRSLPDKIMGAAAFGFGRPCPRGEVGEKTDLVFSLLGIFL